MIDLYAAPTSNGIRAKIMLDECDLAYTLHKVNLREGEHKTPEFRAMNPFAMTPVIVDGDGPGGRPVTISQSVAILFYLAEKSGRFLPQDPAARAAFWDPMMSIATDIGPTYGAMVFAGRVAEPHEPTRQAFLGRMRDYLTIWDGKLQATDFCAGHEVSIADFALFGIHARTEATFPEACRGLGGLSRWFDAMKARPGVQKGLDFG
jgi:GSH-dependent disulfide-bond oxidoreductase